MDVQKLSALSASLARVVSSAEEEEAELDQFPVEGVREAADTICCVFLLLCGFTMTETQIITLSFEEARLIK